MNTSVELIPLSVAQSIARSNAWEEGDTWVIGNGRVVKYDGDRFFIQDRRRKTTLGSVPFAVVMKRGREA